MLVLQSDNNLCSKSVRRYEQCRKLFVDTTDKIVINTFGTREVTQKSERTKNQTPNAWKGELKLHNIKFTLIKIYIERVQYCAVEVLINSLVLFLILSFDLLFQAIVFSTIKINKNYLQSRHK